MSHIDSIDEQILGELQANGRLTMKALAERVGLSSPAMIERVRRLETRGVIAGYRAIVAPEALGRPVESMVLARVLRAEDDAFAKIVQDNAAIVECQRLTGAWSHVLRAHVADLAELERLVDSLRDAGAVCEPSIVTSSPLTWREMTPPGECGPDRARAARRGRPAEAEPDGAPAVPEPPHRRGPGRPRVRRTAS